MMPASTNFTSQADAEREECSGAWEFVAALAARSSGEFRRTRSGEFIAAFAADAEREERSGEFVAALAARSSGEQDRSKG